MNPLDFPAWGQQPNKEPRPQARKANQPSRNDLTPDSTQISVRIFGDVAKRDFNKVVPYVEGQSLDRYMDPLRIKLYAIKHRVYDLNNLSKGPIRMTYVPGPGAQIVMGSRSFNPRYLLPTKGVQPVPDPPAKDPPRSKKKSSAPAEQI